MSRLVIATIALASSPSVVIVSGTFLKFVNFDLSRVKITCFLLSIVSSTVTALLTAEDKSASDKSLDSVKVASLTAIAFPVYWKD